MTTPAERSQLLLVHASNLQARAQALRFRAFEVDAGRSLVLTFGKICLPDAVLRIIFLLLPPKTRAVCAAVSSSWRDLLKKPGLWSLLEFDAAKTSSEGLLACAVRAKGALNSLFISGKLNTYHNDDYYYKTARTIVCRAIREECVLNPNLRTLVVEGELEPADALALFAACTRAEFAARVTVERNDVTLADVLGLFASNADGLAGAPRVASLSLPCDYRLADNFWVQPTAEAGVDAFSAALARHKSLKSLSLTYEDAPRVLGSPA